MYPTLSWAAPDQFLFIFNFHSAEINGIPSCASPNEFPFIFNWNLNRNQENSGLGRLDRFSPFQFLFLLISRQAWFSFSEGPKNGSYGVMLVGASLLPPLSACVRGREPQPGVGPPRSGIMQKHYENITFWQNFKNAFSEINVFAKIDECL